MRVDRPACVAHLRADVQGAPGCIKQSLLAPAVTHVRAAANGAPREQLTLHIGTNAFACTAESVSTIAEVPK